VAGLEIKLETGLKRLETGRETQQEIGLELLDLKIRVRVSFRVEVRGSVKRKN
jgi:hypothetical protein